MKKNRSAEANRLSCKNKLLRQGLCAILAVILLLEPMSLMTFAEDGTGDISDNSEYQSSVELIADDNEVVESQFGEGSSQVEEAVSVDTDVPADGSEDRSASDSGRGESADDTTSSPVDDSRAADESADLTSGDKATDESAASTSGDHVADETTDSGNDNVSDVADESTEQGSTEPEEQTDQDDQDIPSTGLIAAEDIWAKEFDDAGAAKLTDVGKTGKESGFGINIYYLFEENSHLIYKRDDFGVKYQMEFQSDKDLDAEAVEIRIPAGFITYGENDDTVPVYPSAVGVPEAVLDEDGNWVYTETEDSDFNYYFDNDTGELVFINYAPIKGESVNAVQVVYSNILIAEVTPDMEWSVVPAAKITTDGTEIELPADDVEPIAGKAEFVFVDDSEVPADDSDPEKEAENKDTEEEADDMPMLRSVNELKALPAANVGAVYIYDGLMRAASDRAWSYDVYYVNQNDPHHIYKYDDFNLKYQMEFKNSVDLEQFAVQIRIPRSLIAYGHGDEVRDTVAPTAGMDIAVPAGTYNKTTGEYTYTSARRSSFNYYYDEETDELVFFNYRAIPSGSTDAWQVLFKTFDTMKIEDGFHNDVTPDVKVTVNGEEQTLADDEVPHLELDVDTRIQINYVVKETGTLTGKSYGPGLYTPNQVSAFVPDLSSVTIPGSTEKLVDHFSDYVYALWKVRINGYANQPYSVDMLDFSSKDNQGVRFGFIVGVSDSDIDATKGLHEQTQADSFVVDDYSETRTLNKEFYVVYAYPRNEVVVNQTVLDNFILVTMNPFDGKDDPQTRPADAHWTYVDYEWHYGRDIIGIDKGVYQTKDSSVVVKRTDMSAWTTARRFTDAAVDMRTGSFTTTGICRSFSLTHEIDNSNGRIGEYIPGRYVNVRTVDDVVYAYPQDGADIGSKYILTKDDYYFSDITVRTRDSAWDVWEDQSSNSLVPVASTTDVDGWTLDRGMAVYAMFAKDADGNPTTEDVWEPVGYVEWSPSGVLTYKFTDAQVAREPWRIGIEHNTVDYVTYSDIDCDVVIKANAPTFERFADADHITLENLSGITGDWYWYDSKIGDFHTNVDVGDNYKEEGLLELTQNLYGYILMRDNGFVELNPILKDASAEKKATARNNQGAGRVELTYSMSAEEGYWVYDLDVLDLLENSDLQSPDRKEVVFYDLLPAGVQFDPSVPIRASRKTEDYSGSSSNQIKVTFDPATDIIEDYNGTGRTRLAFHISYTGRDSTSVRNSSTSGYKWLTGYNLSFGAYLLYEDLMLAQEQQNIVAYMPANNDQRPILGTDEQVSLDNGEVHSGDGFSDYYEDLAGNGDINQDGLYDTRNVLYAQSSKLEDIAIASPAGIQKYVRANSDPFGEYRKSTLVFPGEEYEYKIIVSNASSSKMHNVVIFDKLENAIVDRQAEESERFEDKDWKGTFNGVVLSDLIARGANPVVYYNADRDATVPAHNSQIDPSEILTSENGWIKASEWSGTLADVKAIAIDCRVNDFTMEQQDDISVRINMIAPETYDETAVWAYNNPGFYSEMVDTNTKGTLWGSSVKVKMVQADSLELMKTLSDNTPAAAKGEEFKFFLEWDDGETTTAYSYKEYKLYEKDSNGEWKIVSGMHATDKDGALYLTASQKAVFEKTEAAHIVVTEEESLRFTPDEDSLEGTIENGIRTVDVLNEYHPILYFTKHVAGYSSPDVEAINLQSFKMKLVDNNGTPVANTQIYVVRRADLGGGEPIVIDASHKLYGEIAKGTPTYARTLTTDAEGVFEIYPEETVAIPLDTAGVTYRVTELEECYAEDTEWICDAPSVETTLADTGSLLQITNKYRWKNLMITKTVQNAGSRDLSDVEFTFKVYEADPSDANAKGTLLTDFVWQVIDNRNSAFDESGWRQPNEDGSITAACAGKVVVVRKFKAGTKLVVEEILDGEVAEYFAIVEGQDSVLIPKFASAGYADIVNEFLLRDLRVGKFVITDGQSNTYGPRFTFTLETCPADADDSQFLPAAGVGFTVYGKDENGNDVPVFEGVTDDDGSFILGHNMYALFKDLGTEGLKYRVRETIDEEFPPVVPLADPDNEGYTEYLSGTLSANNSVEFINGDDSVFVFRKNWIGQDEISQQFIDANSSNLSCGIRLDFHGVPVSVVSAQGTNLYYPSSPYSYYDFTVYEENAYVIFKVDDSENSGYYDIPSIDYTLEETSYPYMFQYSYSGYYPKSVDAPYTYYNGHLLMLNGMNHVSVEGTVGERREIILENHLEEVSSYLQKRVTGKSVPAGSKLVWRIEQYNGNTWEPASGIEYSLVSNSYAVYQYEGSQYYDQHSTDRAGEPVHRMMGVTGEDGLISIVNDAEFWPSSVTKVTDPFNYGTDQKYVVWTGAYFYVFFGQKVSAGPIADPNVGDLRAVEVESLSDKEWGTRTAYITSGIDQGLPMSWASSSFAGSNSVKGFVNSTNYSKLKVSKVVDVPTSQVFNFRLQKYTDPVSGSALVNGENISYKVYDSETDEEISEGVTGTDGGFTLQGGQYAVFDVAPGSTWKVTELDPLPYYLEKIEVGGVEIPNGGNSADAGQLIDSDLNMIRRDFFNGMGELMSLVGATQYYPGYLYSYPQYPSNRIRNIYFGKTSDYPSVVSDTYVTMDASYQGNIRGYAVPNSDNSELYDVYILSDDVMFTNYDCSYMFGSLYGLEGVYFSNVDTSLTKRMNGMFSWCPYLTTISGMSSWDTSSVTDMSYMFQNQNYSNLRQIDLANWDVSNVKNMTGMFAGNYNLEQIDVSGWKTANVESMAEMFQNCYRLTSLDVSGWNTGKVKDMRQMFAGCSSLQTLDVSGFNTANVENMNGMFSSCSNLTSLNVSGFNTSNVKDMGHMFSGCNSLATLNVSGFKTSNVTNMHGMFNWCNSLTSLNLSGWNTASVQDMGSMFSGCSSLTTLNLSGWTTTSVQNMNNMFYQCSSLTSLNLSGWNTSSVTDMGYMFSGCSELTTLNLSGWSTGNVTNMQSMFSGCTKLQNPDIAGWDTSKVGNMSYMFNNCDGLTTLDLSSWNTGNVTNMAQMFYDCDNLTTVDLSSWTMRRIRDMSSMFRSCDKLTTIDLTNCNLANSNINNSGISSMFRECPQLTTIYCNYDWTPKFSGTNSWNSSSYVFYGDRMLTNFAGNQVVDYSHCHTGTGGYFTEK